MNSAEKRLEKHRFVLHCRDPGRSAEKVEMW